MKRITYFMLLAGAMLCMNSTFAQEDVTIDGYEQFIEFRDAHTGTPIDVNNLTIKNVMIDMELPEYEGYETDVEATNALFATLPEAVKKVNGTLTLENMNLGDLHWFPNIEFNGGFHFKDLPNLVWIQGFSGNGEDAESENWPTRTVVHGDFIVENCPQVAFPNIDGWRSTLWFGGFERVEGDFVIDGFDGELSYETANKLTYVGGDFILKNPVRLNDKNSWEMGFRNLTTVMGNFEIDGNMASRREPDTSTEDPTDSVDVYIAWWSLNMLGSLQSVGGDVRIVNIPNMQLAGQGEYPYGYCTVRYLAELGAINVCNKIEIGFTEEYGEPLNLDEVGICNDGHTIGEAFPVDRSFCESGIGMLQQDNSFANVFVVGNVVTIECEDDITEGVVYNLTGDAVKTFNEKQVDINDLPQGIYLIKLTTTANQTAGYKIMR